MEDRFTGRLHITGVVRNGDSELYFGVPRRHPELARVLDRGLAALSPAELAEIKQRWLFVTLDPGLRWRDLLRWLVPLAAVLLTALLVLWLVNRRLRLASAVAEAARAEAEAATAARGRFLAYLAHEVVVSLRRRSVMPSTAPLRSLLADVTSIPLTVALASLAVCWTTIDAVAFCGSAAGRFSGS